MLELSVVVGGGGVSNGDGDGNGGGGVLYVNMRVSPCQRSTSYIIPQKPFLLFVVGSLVGIGDSLVWLDCLAGH